MMTRKLMISRQKKIIYNRLLKQNRITMKRVMLLMLAVTTAFAAYAQPKNVNKANTAFTKGELAEAAALIEPAIQDAKTKEKGRTWYVRGQIYGAIAMSDDEALRNQYPDALNKAVESYKKVLELEKDGSSYHGLATINYDQLAGSVLNKGVEAFQSDDFEGALAAFDEYTKVKPDDTTGYIYAALMAQQLEKYQDVVNYYDGLFALDYYTKTGLNTVIYYELNNLENPEKALEYVRLAKDKFPEDNNFNKTEVDILIRMDKIDDAIAELQHAIELEPESASLYSNLGLLYDSKGEYEKAVEQYKKALELNPADRFSLINLAVFYIGQGDKINKKALDMDVATFRKDGAKVEAQAKEEWSKAIPLLEKVLEGSPDDELALQNLHAVYYKLKDYENAKKMEDRRRELGYIVDDKQ